MDTRPLVLIADDEPAATRLVARGDAAYLRLWIGQLRRRLGVPAWEEGPIRTVSGLGYALDLAGAHPPRRPCRPRSTIRRTGRQCR